MKMFDELANLLDVFIILVANLLPTLIGRARYHVGLAINHLAKGDHFLRVLVDARLILAICSFLLKIFHLVAMC
jgi:hypothetical protein